MKGHVRKRAASWAYVMEGPRKPDGRRSQHWHSGFRTRRDAESALAQALVAAEKGAPIRSRRLTLAQFLDDIWLGLMTQDVRPATAESYERNVRLHIRPALGHLPLVKIDAVTINALYSRLLREGRTDDKGGLSPRTVHYLHTILHRIMNDAMLQDLIAVNPVDRATAPRPRQYRRYDQPVWSVEQMRAFLDGTKDDPESTLWVLLASTGMRRGEALGLKWDRLDWEAPAARIVETLVSVGAEVQWSTPKTNRGRRSVSLAEEVCQSLRAHRVEQARQKLLAGPLYVDSGLVFCDPLGAPLQPKNITKRFQRRSRQLGLPQIRLHDLRHSYATLALSTGMPTKILSERIGHASTAITADLYQHVTLEMQATEADKTAQLLFRRPAN